MVKVSGTEHVVLTRISGRMGENHIKVAPGDRVVVELSPDLLKSRAG